MGTLYNLFDIVGRILISFMFLHSGVGKIGAYQATGRYMQSHGVPAALLPLVIILEVAGSICIILGYKTRLSAFLLAGFCILAPLLFHSNIADQTQWLMFIKDISIAGGFLVIFGRGAGAFSLDSRFRHTQVPGP